MKEQEQRRCGLCGTTDITWHSISWHCNKCGVLVTTSLVPDPISPQHYVKRGIEVRHVISAFECTYNVGTAVAYLLRAPFKGRYLEDIRKAIQHLNFELEDKGGGDGVGNGGDGSK